MNKYKYYKYKTKYINLRSLQTGGTIIYTQKHTKKTFSGAGIILIEMYKNKPTVILFKSKRKEGVFYEGLGGGVDKKDLYNLCPLAATAIREAFEESMGLVYFPDVLKIIRKVDNLDRHIDIKYKNNYYRAYIIAIESNIINENDYNHNNKILLKNTISSVYKETTAIGKFYIDDLIKDGLLTTESHFNSKTINGNIVTIFNRTREVLKKAYLDGNITTTLKYPIKLIKLNTFIGI